MAGGGIGGGDTVSLSPVPGGGCTHAKKSFVAAEIIISGVVFSWQYHSRLRPSEMNGAMPQTPYNSRNCSMMVQAFLR